MPQITKKAGGSDSNDESSQQVYYLTDIFPHLSYFALDVTFFRPHPQAVTEEHDITPIIDHTNEEANDHPSTLRQHPSTPQTGQTPHRIASSLTASSPNTYKYLAMSPTNNSYDNLSVTSLATGAATPVRIPSERQSEQEATNERPLRSSASNKLPSTSLTTGAATPITNPHGRQSEQQASNESPVRQSKSDSRWTSLDVARSYEAPSLGSVVAAPGGASGSSSSVRNASDTSGLFVREKSIPKPASGLGSTLSASQPLGLPGPSQPRSTDSYQTSSHRYIPYRLPVLTNQAGFPSGSHGQGGPGQSFRRGLALSESSSVTPASPPPARKLTVRNGGPDDSIDSSPSPAGLSPTSPLATSRHPSILLTHASVPSSAVSSADFPRQTSSSNGASHLLHTYSSHTYPSLTLAHIPSHNAGDETPSGSPPADSSSPTSLPPFDAFPPRLNSIPLSDPVPDNMAYYNSPRLNIDNMVSMHKSSFDSILAAWTCYPERAETGGCDAILHRLNELEMDWSIVQGKLEEVVERIPEETRGAVLLSDTLVPADTSSAAAGQDVKGKGKEKITGRGLRRMLSSIFSSSGKEHQQVSSGKEGRSLRKRVSEHFRRGASSKEYDGKERDKEVKVVQRPLLWIDQMAMEIAEGLRRVQELREDVEAVRRSKDAY
ncbi:hypothetical protein BZA77DRAFT_296053 [Pyronema omphalodes]|nr:hypothetical protein BZA77DRAFT_296053 [Pyronema omphalodes]